MAIYHNGKEITGIHWNDKIIQQVWKFIDGKWRIVWNAIKGVFGNGIWLNKEPWINKEGWKN